MARVTTPATTSSARTPACTATAPPKLWPTVTAGSGPAAHRQLEGGEQVVGAALEVVRRPPPDPNGGDPLGGEGDAEVVVEAVGGAEQAAHGAAAAGDDGVLVAGAVPQQREQALHREHLDVVEAGGDGHLLGGECVQRLERGGGHGRR